MEKKRRFFARRCTISSFPVYLGEHTVRIVGRASPVSRWTFFLSVGAIIFIRSYSFSNPELF